MYVNHILVVHYITPQYYIWLVFYNLGLMIMGWKVPCWTFNDYSSFAAHPLQLRAFSHIMSKMITKSVIYGIIDLRISSNVSTKVWILPKWFHKLLVKVHYEELSLSDFFQQALELQHQNEASILNAEMQVKCGTFSSTLPLVIEHTYWACW